MLVIKLVKVSCEIFNLGLTKPLCSFRLVLEGKTSKGLTESSRLEFLETFSVNNFALSDAEDSNLGLLIFFFFFFFILIWIHSMQG